MPSAETEANVRSSGFFAATRATGGRTCTFRTMSVLPRYIGSRYVQPLREGGSLPAIIDTDAGLFVAKFRGAGQGPKALVAEIIVAEIARALGFRVPELVLLDIDEAFGRSEPDPEIQELLRASHGINVGLRYLDGAFNFDGFAAGDLIEPSFAADLVWLDAFLTNPDRTHRNPNLLVWERTPWLIDHGAALYAHHQWSGVDETRTRSAFPMIRDHVLLSHADDLVRADARLAPRMTPELIDDVLAAVPDELLMDPVNRDSFGDASEARARYREYLLLRVAHPRSFVDEAVRAQRFRLTQPVQRRMTRR